MTNREEQRSEERINPPDKTSEKIPYLFPKEQKPLFTAPAPQRRTWAGFVDATYFQFQPVQPVWHFSDDFLYNTLDRLLGFDSKSKIWRPLKVDELGQIVTSGTLSLDIPPIFEDDFNGIILDPNTWDTAGTVSVGASAVNLETNGAYIRTKNLFSRTASKPLILTVEAFLEEAPDGVTGSDYSFGFMDATESNPISGTLQNGVFCRVYYDSSDYVIELYTVTDGAEEPLNQYTLTTSSAINVFQLVLEDYAAYVYVNGVQRIVAPTTDFTEVAPLMFPSTTTFKTFLLNSNADTATFYRLTLSQVNEAILMGGYDVNGYKAAARFTADGRLMTDTEFSTTAPMGVKILDVDYNGGSQTDPLETVINSGTITKVQEIQDAKVNPVVIFLVVTLTANYSGNIGAMTGVSTKNTVVLYPQFDPADTSGGTSADILIEVSFNNIDWHIYELPDYPTGYTLQSDGALRYTYSGVAAQTGMRLIIPKVCDPYLRVSVKENGATNFGTCTLVGQAGWT